MEQKRRDVEMADFQISEMLELVDGMCLSLTEGEKKLREAVSHAERSQEACLAAEARSEALKSNLDKLEQNSAYLQRTFDKVKCAMRSERSEVEAECKALRTAVAEMALLLQLSQNA